MTTGESPRPLRLLVDLTPMLIASNQVQIPAGFAYQLRFAFRSWRVTGDVNKSLFTYTPSKEAKAYSSLEEYYETIAGVMSEHPLLGKEIPKLEGSLLGGQKISSDSFSGKVVVLDFWATWCAPCVASLPAIKQVTDQYADQDVLFYALNTGEQAEEVQQFLKEQEFSLNVILDPDGKIATDFRADAIPQTLVIGKDGMIESAHIGFVGEEAMKQRLKDELDVLTIGGRIASAQTAGESEESSGESADQQEGQR
jgi:thiol-disulfide isomerase/thioredoxin